MPFLLLAAFAGLSTLWNLPVALSALGWPWFTTAAVEVAAIFLLLALAPPLRRGGSSRLTAMVIALATTVVVVLALGELLIRESLSRSLNLLVDIRLASSLVHLLTDNFPGARGWLAVAGLAVLPLVVCAAAYGAARMAQRTLENRPLRALACAVCGALIAGFAVAWWRPPIDGRHEVVASRATARLLEQWRSGRQAVTEMRAFASAIAEDRFRATPASDLLSRLNGADVLLVFIESYGRGALELPRYTGSVTGALAAFEERLADRGLMAVSGWLTSPTVGGQSWLAHGTFESGLWLSDQTRYDVLMPSSRLTLTRAFGRAGYRTVALKPAITRPWPEGDHHGFARIYAAADLGYAGEPYSWVTMPDQYTLSALQRYERERADRPLFAQVSLISSHAPWTPVAEVLEDWSAIGDGRVFSRWANEGEPPRVVWKDPERIRRQYPLAVEYVIGVLSSYAANFVDDRVLLIMVGDHQPAPVVTGEGAGSDVPIHVISGDAALLAPFEAWGLARGMRPPASLPARRMDTFRDFFLDAFSPGSSESSPR